MEDETGRCCCSHRMSDHEDTSKDGLGDLVELRVRHEEKQECRNCRVLHFHDCAYHSLLYFRYFYSLGTEGAGGGVKGRVSPTPASAADEGDGVPADAASAPADDAPPVDAS